MVNKKPAIGMITTGLLMGLVLSSVDQTIVSTAMPTISKQLGGLSLYSWVFAIYMLASTTSMPIYGKLADLFGRKRLYVTGLLLFLTGSALCGIASNMTELIIYRGIQGLGAGALMPVAFTIVADIYPPEKIGKFQGLFSAVFAISSVIGPALGGFIVEHLHWSWIFYLNLPIGIPALLLIVVALNESKSNEKRSIDWTGALTLIGAVVSFLLPLVLVANEQTNRTHWGSPLILGLFAAGAVFLGCFLWIENNAKEPIIPLHLFKIRAIAFGNIAGFFVSAGLFSAIAYLPLFVQGVVGVSPSVAGYILTPLMVSTVITSNIGGRHMSKVSYRAILVPSLLLMAIGFGALSQMTVDTTKLQIVLYMIVIGLGMGAVYPTIATAAAREVDYRNRGAATSSSQFFRSIGGTIGVSVLGSLLAQWMSSGINTLHFTNKMSGEQLQKLTNPQTLLDADARSSLPYEVMVEFQKLVAYSFNHLFLVALFFICISLIACIFMGKARLIKPSEG